MKKKLVHSTKLLIIGVVLLVFSAAYLHNHPGEKASIMPSFQMLSYKGKILLYKTLGKDTQSLETKHEFEKLYTELLYLIEESNCMDPDIMKDIQTQQEEFKKVEHSAENEQYRAATKIQALKERIEKECTTIQYE